MWKRAEGKIMSLETSHRQSVTIDKANWDKYCEIKTKYMREIGKPELSFTEFMNAAIHFSNVTLKQILELRRARAR